jgi:hypothetical protein
MAFLRLHLTFLVVLLAFSRFVAASPDGDEHAHMGHAEPLRHINETEILQHHDPDPLSYWAHDGMKNETSYRALMVAHVVGMCLAYWLLLPTSKHFYPAHEFHY